MPRLTYIHVGDSIIKCKSFQNDLTALVLVMATRPATAIIYLFIYLLLIGSSPNRYPCTVHTLQSTCVWISNLRTSSLFNGLGLYWSTSPVPDGHWAGTESILLYIHVCTARDCRIYARRAAIAVPMGLAQDYPQAVSFRQDAEPLTHQSLDPSWLFTHLHWQGYEQWEDRLG